MSTATITPRAHELLDRVDGWARRRPVRAVVIKAAVTVVGPLIALAGVAMLVLPGPGLVVIALGLAVLALEYEWARRALRLMGRALSRSRDAALPKDGSRGRRALGVAAVAAFAVATFALTTAVTTLLGAYTIL
jgi:uncharacterized protein (TIGR02611 family)